MTPVESFAGAVDAAKTRLFDSLHFGPAIASGCGVSRLGTLAQIETTISPTFCSLWEDQRCSYLFPAKAL